MFYNARWMDPATGRFSQADSIVPDGVQGMDRYGYVNNNPLQYTDPTGHDPEGNCYDRGYCTRNEALHIELDKFIEPERYSKDEMVPYLGNSLSPDEIDVIQSSDNSIIVGVEAGVLSESATYTARKTFPDLEQHNDPSDAFRHAYWNALLTRVLGDDFAEAFTNAHETEYAPPEYVTDPHAETFMDLFNNAVGRRIAASMSNSRITNVELQAKIYDALKNGQLIVWDGNDIYYSDECPSCIYP